MESFWKGTFAKHLKSVRLVSLAHMTKEDWDILDYPNLRPSAQYNLDRQIIAGDLYGFYIVRVDQHLGKAHSPHGGKGQYNAPAGKAALSGGRPSQTEFPEDFGFDSEVKQEDVPPRPAGYFALLTALFLLTQREQEAILKKIEAEAPDPDDELLDEEWPLWNDVARVLTLLARAYRMGDRGKFEELLFGLRLTLAEIRDIEEEIEEARIAQDEME